MRGLKLLATTALAANKNTCTQTRQGAQMSVEPFVTEGEKVTGRRKALQQILAVGVIAASSPPKAFALDMDAFANSELAADQKNCDPKRDPKCAPQLTADEAMCKYGQSGEARGEACKRVKKAGGSLPGATKTKSLGGAYAM